MQLDLIMQEIYCGYSLREIIVEVWSNKESLHQRRWSCYFLGVQATATVAFCGSLIPAVNYLAPTYNSSDPPNKIDSRNLISLRRIRCYCSDSECVTGQESSRQADRASWELLPELGC